MFVPAPPGKMSVARSLCLGCLLDVANQQPLVEGMEQCGQCQLNIRAPAIVVWNTGELGLQQKLFNRLVRPRALSIAKAQIYNITKEQFNTWKRDSWGFIGRSRTRMYDNETWVILEWSDVKSLCSFEVFASGTREPTQGLGNMRVAANGTMGVICPPITLVHK